ncbi:MAG: CHAT domain-containing protein [Microcystis sp. M54BS1]|uniref:CHAT domain-containing protein n=1 Tax=unclassified Microcystis TaxID=2643300 RepID=UPI00257D5640|nr:MULTISPECIES: CHAT domain-containing protein [unclassified Microcystis]MCA2541650.1 CHAT domain-containing protein [Microcystis sp. M54BS1]MCA2597991.1 CHAT domain-containing protein [Microcystis sp. M38BS1]MCA2612703.1 CHAT domain-containing protein [Microcystis sp. M27BS1]MCA2505000.1 CHAT domain-containing protein [Microcystis sp. M62BS1]MCA2512976.1 CHAT domain-containing protein [Microcystis sp. M60BS1]
MKILHIDLQERGSNSVEFRFFWDNPNQTRTYTRFLSEIKNLSGRADTDYYTRLPEDHAKTGQGLYRWLDGTERILQNELDSHRGEKIVLAISTSKGLVHLPWELLHDGQNFLVSKLPAIVPMRWMKTGNERLLTVDNNPQDRALNVVFMASSAKGVKPILDFEAEEGKILKATRGKPLSLTVEESGCIQELGELIASKDRGYFDVIHLSGHATIKERKPYFITETEYGDRQDTSAEDIARELQFNLPKLLFLSGCRTGYSDGDEILSMAEKLLENGAKAVLGWGQPVRDNEAADTAAILYEKLSQGFTLSESLAFAYQKLLGNQARDWHCLRLYVRGSIPEALVKRGQKKPLPPVSFVDKFVDPETKYLRVATRETFIGRRRDLQDCLQVLKKPFDNSKAIHKAGVFLQGFGGNGKSTLAARLCDRLPDYTKLVWHQQIDQTSLVDTLAKKLDRPQRQTLLDSNEDLDYRLRDVFSQLNQPFLLILDDLEWNLECPSSSDDYILKAGVAQLLQALVWAIQETNYYHRLIITSRYTFNSPLLEEFYHLESLPSFKYKESDLQKKLRRLEHFSSGKIDKNYIERALTLADGNPRLLEWLNNEVLSSGDIDAKLQSFENESDVTWRDKIVWRLEEKPQLLTDEALEKVVSNCLIYEIPVPLAALEAVCQSVPNYQKKLQQAQDKGLIEVIHNDDRETLYRASHIKHINPHIELPKDASKLSGLAGTAAKALTELWGNKENENEEKWVEIFRLAFAETENPERFRQQFDKMISVQYNREADKAYEKELRKHRKYLKANTGQIYQKLERYLEQQDWKKADYETAFIMYQWMVIKNFADFYIFFRSVSLKVIDEIDRLWVKYSEGKFGIRGQAKIYRDLKGKKKYNEEVWERFGARVGWREEDWLQLEEAYHATTQAESHFPILMYNRVSGCSRFGLWGLCGAERELSSNMPGGVDVVFPRVKT